MRFRLESAEQDDEEISSPEEEPIEIPQEPIEIPHSNAGTSRKSGKAEANEETVYPESISIDELLKAGQLVKPKTKNNVSLLLERFDMKAQEWVPVEKSLDVLVDTERFAFGGFRDAFLGVSRDGSRKKWVLKTYNEKAVRTITVTMNSNPEDHTRKNIQMHYTARHLAKVFSTKAPEAFGECFKFNRAYYTVYLGQPTTVEEFVEGAFRKYINNNGKLCKQPEGCSDDVKTIFDKAEALVHFSYVHSSKKLMLLDLQGADYHLYDPEIATTELHSENEEAYFCIGNLSYISIDAFIIAHNCTDFCKMIDTLDNHNSVSTST